MTPPAAEQRDDTEPRTIQFATTPDPQRALHEAIGHLYDELAMTRADQDDDETSLPDELFEQIEDLYVATAEESVSRVELTYELEEQ